MKSTKMIFKKYHDYLSNKKGFIPPRDFIRNFGHVHIPELIYQGELTDDFIESIRNDSTLKEGVVIKGTRQTKGLDMVWMSKIKTNVWLEKIREKLGEKALIEEFNGKIELITI